MVRLTVDREYFNKTLKKMESDWRRYGRQMSLSGLQLTRSLTLPILGIGAAAIKSFADFERLETALTQTVGSAAQAAIEMKALAEIAKQPGIGYEQALEAATGLRAMGESAEFTQATLSGFAKAVALSGGTAENFSSVLVQMRQTLAKGFLDQQSFRIIQEQIPKALEVMRERFGTTSLEAIRASYSARQFWEIMIQGMNALPEPTETTANALNNFGTEIKKSMAELGGAIVTSTGFNEILGKVSGYVETLTGRFADMSTEGQKSVITLALIGAGLGPLAQFIGNISVAGALLPAAIKNIAKLVSHLKPLVLYLTRLSTLGVTVVAGIVAFSEEIAGFARIARYTGNMVIPGLSGAWVELFDAITKAKNALYQFLGLQKLLGGGKGESKSVTNDGYFFGQEWMRPAPSGYPAGTEPYVPTPVTPKPDQNKEAIDKAGLTSLANLRNITDLLTPLRQVSADVLPGINTQLDYMSEITERARASAGEFADQFVQNWQHIGEWVDLGISAFQEFGDIVGQSFADIANGQKSFAEALGSAWDNIKKRVVQALAAMIAKALAAIAVFAVLRALSGGIGALAGTASGLLQMLGGLKGLLGTFTGLPLGKPTAKGGIFYGPSNRLVGEYPGARGNPEVVAPLDKLKSMLGGGVGGGMELTTRVSGNDLLLVLSRANFNRSASASKGGWGVSLSN